VVNREKGPWGWRNITGNQGRETARKETKRLSAHVRDEQSVNAPKTSKKGRRGLVRPKEWESCDLSNYPTRNMGGAQDQKRLKGSPKRKKRYWSGKIKTRGTCGNRTVAAKKNGRHRLGEDGPRAGRERKGVLPLRNPLKARPKIKQEDRSPKNIRTKKSDNWKRLPDSM